MTHSETEAQDGRLYVPDPCGLADHQQDCSTTTGTLPPRHSGVTVWWK